MLCRKQQEVLAHALHVDLRLPLVDNHPLPETSLCWSKQEQKRPVQLSLDKLKALENYVPEEVKSRQVPWRDAFLHRVRERGGK